MGHRCHTEPRVQVFPTVLLTKPAKRKVLLAAWCVLFLLATPPLFVGFFVTPEDLDSGRVVLTPPCPYKKWTGHDCPSCGLTRAFAALCHGRMTDALRYHRGAPFVYGLMTIAALFAVRGVVVTRRHAT